MKKYRRLKESEIEIKSKEEQIIGLKNSKYHLHLKDLEEGYIPLEMEMLSEIFNINNLNIDKLSEEQYFKSLEYIFEKIQIIVNIKKEIN